jgi:succinyl-CoA synthetase beta subunit
LMRLLEYEAKELLAQIGVKVPLAKIVRCPGETSFETPCMVKAQVPISNRIRQGGVRFAATHEEAMSIISELLRSRIAGRLVEAVLIEEVVSFHASYYIGVMASAASRRPTLIFGTEGGVGVEEAPTEALHTMELSAEGFRSYSAWRLLLDVGIRRPYLVPLANVITKIVDTFLRYDATLLEINPLVLTQEGDAIALDCHCEIDDDALWRQPYFKKLDLSLDRKARPQTELEHHAESLSKSEHRGVTGNVVEFDGELSLIMGGGGASLAIFDAIRRFSGAPANYCEVGGNPSVKKLAELTSLLVSLPRSRGLAVIMNVLNNTRVDLLARGVIKGVLDAHKSPSETILVFRAPGAWEEEGKRILSKYGVPFFGRQISLSGAAQVAVAKVNELRARWES